MKGDDIGEMNHPGGKRARYQRRYFCHSALGVDSREQGNTTGHFPLGPDSTLWIAVFRLRSRTSFLRMT